MRNKNAEFFKGPSFEEVLENALQQHTSRVVGNSGKHYFREPTRHDIKYQFDPITGNRVHFPDGVPVEPSLGSPEPEDIADRVRRQIQGKELARLARELGADTFEEAQDFDVEPDQDKCPFSGHEYSEQDEQNDAVLYANLVKANEEKEKQEKLEAKRQEYKDLKAHFEQTEPAPATSPPAPKSED